MAHAAVSRPPRDPGDGSRVPVNASRNLWVLARPSEDIPDQWSVHCLDLDIVSAGDSLEDALEMIVEAVGMCVADDLKRGLDPFGRNRAPQEYWDELERVTSRGSYGLPPTGMPAAVATQLRLESVQPDGHAPGLERLPPAWMLEPMVRESLTA
jgi:hypothetical protein